jgi:hypothetical protein
MTEVAQRDAEPHPDVVEVGTAVERLVVGLHRLAQLAGLPVGVSDARLQIGELAAGGGIEHAGGRRGDAARALGDLARALEVALSLVEAASAASLV